ncbi:miaA [Wigglesworthia glossinidia endosymbiont of Glossina brevipalpis]|uniref:tRNA dimethylallyltransferase n=1 Tax=Wigglesworthia glossinidia brevipalpis TaxID=36870 RepID=MIAA_WIGBR|nr:RecName: Full=tRNA dimethylallyltransferase; AltName: Full=Dimethylallyl diphosphate:tRNA dimethylallyltransferase; Short=DMAPP:tRNA dimethylallyltransferase; Short=DMATase; AltName: Full=Isopentenyl-diphosphate:tRNA isopentenyltransferase; Short=IPP transferase; Short=IPPT; Short=IPTase [Wigglesworthia glossinidia endosymbiont of Glossina brevipalpis]BAC24329.1 miaA [Wigglesworthia glossinidia endosymbiont of Glossina brevipalpis]
MNENKCTDKINNLPKAIFIMGQTAVGKTKIAEILKKKLPVEIISVDSGCIYKGMNIGTDKPNVKKSSSDKYHLIDICEPNDYYSVENFRLDALKIMEKISKKGLIPLLVGGSMFYFKSLLHGLSNLPSYNIENKNLLKKKINEIGWYKSYIFLKKIDPIFASNIHPNDHYRLTRALEIYFSSGNIPTNLFKAKTKKLEYNIRQFSIMISDKKILYKKIKDRFFNMLKNGFKKEVEFLKNKKQINKNMPSMRCIGYKQMLAYLSGEINYKEMILFTISATNKLAKKQSTWLKKWKNINYIYNKDVYISSEEIFNILKKDNFID